MRNLIKLAFVGIALFAVSCAQEKKEREEFKDEHQVEEKRVDGTGDAALSSENVPVDSTQIQKIDETK